MIQMPVYVGHVVRFVRAVALRFLDDRGMRVSGALAFSSVLAIVPLMAVGFAMLSMFPKFDTMMGSVQTFIYNNFAPAVGDAAIRYMEEFAANAGKLTAWGLVFLFVTALMLISTIEDAFNDIWRVRTSRRWKQRLMSYWAIVTLGPLLLGVSLSVTAYVVSVSFGQTGAVSTLFLRLVPIVFEFVMFVVLYIMVPNCVVRLRHAAVGALTATIMFEFAKLWFGNFVGSSSTYREIYGAVAVLPVFLIWIQLSWVITLLGAEVAAAMSDRLKPARGIKRTKVGTGNVQTRT
jgi:membrane protein